MTETGKINWAVNTCGDAAVGQGFNHIQHAVHVQHSRPPL